MLVLVLVRVEAHFKLQLAHAQGSKKPALGRTLILRSRGPRPQVWRGTTTTTNKQPKKLRLCNACVLHL